MIGLLDTGVVYIEGSSGAFDTSIKTDLRCRLAHLSGVGVSTQDRAELLERRQLLWEPAYVMPERVQIEVNSDGVRWNVLPATIAALSGPSGAITYRRADAVRAGQ